MIVCGESKTMRKVKLFEMTLDGATITVYKADNGDIVLGGFGWFELYEYEKITLGELDE